MTRARKPNAVGTPAGSLSVTRRAWVLAMPALGFSIVASRSETASPRAEPPQNFIRHREPAIMPDLAFTDGEGRAHTLAELRGKVVLLNVWATWCGPCRTEMPTLDRLQAQLGGPDFQVIALSIDRAGSERVKSFFSSIGVQHLALSLDSSSKASSELSIVGLPATLLVGRDGKELGRLVGPAEWDSPEVIQFLRSVIASDAPANTTNPDGPRSKAEP
jgi:thiol-disulfide isomerase/thioredoxin